MSKTASALRVFENAACLDGPIKLSVLIPFYGDDPRNLLTGLKAQIGERRDLEVVLYDDGRPHLGLNRKVRNAVAALPCPARLISTATNRGRSAGRNILADHARGDWLLYLDADMTPGSTDFIARYLSATRTASFDAAFGGFLTPDCVDGETAIHAALTRVSDEHSAQVRAATGPTAFCSSNLLVRKSVMQDSPFDESFVGWGWEDVEWAVRSSTRYQLIHLDNPAWHGGLQNADTLLRKFESAALNFARLLEKHPHLADLPGAKAARLLAGIPFQSTLRTPFKAAVKAQYLPMRVRTLALKLWRASWAAEAI